MQSAIELPAPAPTIGPNPYNIHTLEWVFLGILRKADPVFVFAWERYKYHNTYSNT